ncbi:hypothetical protein NUW58_g3573 [Xylaria curta]|uniref:Uncharacterized protein n=2 Tax=Xylaria curta TaxID=42375 RepID=A0ACC1PBK6_9PEZI|nr:hypothetical protein NUW58_g4826 [Xylaria curta]KAJ2989238.1 hypothetical protein NUW58_g3573 [Xylaria curta]
MPRQCCRLLRYCASVGLVHETAPGIFAANATTKTLAQPAYEGGIRHYFDSVGPTLQVLPSFLAETKYQDIVNPTDTAFQRAFATDLPALKWLPTQPDLFKAFQQMMTVRGAPGAPWFSVFPFEQELGNFAGAHAFIDVGGGFGHQCLSLRAAFPSLENKIVLQDLPETLKQTSFDLKGILPMAHDFFQPQPLKGARFYYMRNILHDWPDEKCASILRNLASAFGPESQILIDDMVLPDSGAPWEATSLDIKMMALFGARERTTAEWLAVIDAAGLKVSRIVPYSTRCQDSIIQVVAK